MKVSKGGSSSREDFMEGDSDPKKKSISFAYGAPELLADVKTPAKKLPPKRPMDVYVMADEAVALALSDVMKFPLQTVASLMELMQKPILKAPMPGENPQLPCKAMMDVAKAEVIKFLEVEEALGVDSHLVGAFHIASGEVNLFFDWDLAKSRVRNARLDRRRAIDPWITGLAMLVWGGDTLPAQNGIWLCGTRKLSQGALTSLICHEALHNMVRRLRPGYKWLSEETEHVAMAFLGDPQLQPVYSEAPQKLSSRGELPIDDVPMESCDSEVLR